MIKRQLKTDELPEGFGEIDGQPDPRDAEIHRLRTALTEIKNIKPRDLGGGLQTGPQLHFEWAVRIAREALRKPKAQRTTGIS